MSVRKVILNGKETYEVYINVHDARGQRIQRRIRGYSSLRSAHEAEVKFKAKVLNEREQGPRWIWEEWVRHYLERERVMLRASTINNYTKMLGKWVTPHFAGRFLEDITTHEVHEIVYGRMKDRSPASKQAILKIIRRTFQTAHEAGFLAKNPCVGLRVHVPEARQGVLSASEVQKLLEEAKRLEHRYYPIWAIAVFTGMRSGELFALRWHDVDLENGRLYVTRSWSSVNGFGPTKSRRNRTVPIGASLRQLLMELKMKKQPDAEFVLTHEWDWKNGEQAKVLRGFCKSIGITPVKFHDLRATFITQLLLKGVSLAQVMAIVGHSELKTTNRYLRLVGTDLDGATEKLGYSLPKDELAKVIEFRSANAVEMA